MAPERTSDAKPHGSNDAAHCTERCSSATKFTEEATGDLDQLYGFLLERDLDAAGEALEAIEQALTMLETFSLPEHAASASALDDTRTRQRWTCPPT
jgi:cob(I)alamin adenosyltransferase